MSIPPKILHSQKILMLENIPGSFEINTARSFRADDKG
jgi:hypothetical protein